MNNVKENSEKDIRDLVYAVYDAVNNQDIEAMLELFHPKVIRHAMGEIGSEGGIVLLKQTYEKFPKTRFVVEDVIVEGNKAALRIAIHGQDTPNDKPLPLILEIFRFENDKVVEVWGAGISSERFPK